MAFRDPQKLQDRCRWPGHLKGPIRLGAYSALLWSLVGCQTHTSPTAVGNAVQPKAKLEEKSADWPNFSRYREENAKLGQPQKDEIRVVFMGDSITDSWPRVGRFFPDKHYIDRGIGGQTTSQMLLRFQQDVIGLKPNIVVILAGTNDVAGNSGPFDPVLTEGNLASMAELARGHGIRVVLSSITPAFDYPWRPGLQPAQKIVSLNSWISDYASKNGFTYLDYFHAMSDEHQGMKAEYSGDGVHPNAAGYAVMEPLVEQAIVEALAGKWDHERNN